jgi:multiple sugar transport system permease protein
MRQAMSWRGARTGRSGKARVRRLFRSAAQYLVVWALLVVFAFPVYYMVIVSLMTTHETEAWPPLLLPLSFHWQNYETVFTAVPLARWFFNTVRIAFFSVLGTTASSALVGYGFARFRFPLRNVLFMLTLATMMLPGQITLIPQFIVFHKLGWINTYLPLIVPPFFGGGAFFIFMMRQFVMQLPRDLDEAALIDGASYPRILFSVLLPLMKPALGTVAILMFMGSWNDFLGPLIYIQSNKLMTLSIGLRLWDTSAMEYRSQANLMMAMCVVMTAPCVALFFSSQSVFVRGIATTGIKG